MRYAQPEKLHEALTLLADEDWTILSGGTDFYPGLRDQPVTGKVLDIYALTELRQITPQDDFLRIGALVTWSDIVAADLPPAFDALQLAAREIGSIQIQNRATLVGNLCNASPAADGVPPLLILDAEVELVATDSVRRLPLAEFILGNRLTALQKNEMVSAILIPHNALAGKSTFMKLGSRKYLVISISMIAVRLAVDAQQRISAAAISVGSCSLVAKRLTLLEQALIGQTRSEDLGHCVSRAHLSALAPIDDVRATKKYRLDASLELLQRALATIGSNCK